MPLFNQNTINNQNKTNKKAKNKQHSNNNQQIKKLPRRSLLGSI